MTDYAIILFHTTSSAFAAEKALVKAGVQCALIPPPRELSSDCGIAVRISSSRTDAAIRALEGAGVETAGVRRM